MKMRIASHRRPLHEIRKGRDHGGRDPMPQALRFAGADLALDPSRDLRLRAEQKYEHSDREQRCHRGVRGKPSSAIGDDQCTRARRKHRKAVAGLDHRGAGPLLIRVAATRRDRRRSRCPDWPRERRRAAPTFPSMRDRVLDRRTPTRGWRKSGRSELRCPSRGAVPRAAAAAADRSLAPRETSGRRACRPERTRRSRRDWFRPLRAMPIGSRR